MYECHILFSTSKDEEVRQKSPLGVAEGGDEALRGEASMKVGGLPNPKVPRAAQARKVSGLLRHGKSSGCPDPENSTQTPKALGLLRLL